MKSQQTDLEPAKARFLSSLGAKAEDLRLRLDAYLELPRTENRDDLRRRCHALATSAQLFAMHELEETSRSAVSMLDVLRSEGREPSSDEADFFDTMMGRIQSLASSHQSGSYSSSAFRLSVRNLASLDVEQVQEDVARSELKREIEELLRDSIVERSSLYNDLLRQRCEQMGAPHVGILQRLRDGTPAQDLLSDRAVDRVVLRETLEALRTVGALSSACTQASAERDDLELELELETQTPRTRYGAPQWAVMVGVLVAVAIVLAHVSDSFVQPDESESFTDASNDVLAPSRPDITAQSDHGIAQPELGQGADAPEQTALHPVEVSQKRAQPLGPGEGELLIMPGSEVSTNVKVGGTDYGSPPVGVVLREGLHTVVFESQSGTHYRFWHVRAKQRRQVSAP